jgi:hypothetical protein
MSLPKSADCRALVTEIVRTEASELSSALTPPITRAGRAHVGNNLSRFAEALLGPAPFALAQGLLADDPLAERVADAERAGLGSADFPVALSRYLAGRQRHRHMNANTKEAPRPHRTSATLTRHTTPSSADATSPSPWCGSLVVVAIGLAMYVIGVFPPA